MRILITGACSGIGKGIAEKLAHKHEVIISDYDLSMVNLTVEEIKQKGLDCWGVKLDVTNIDDIENLGLLADTKPIDVIINNAGIQYVEKIENFPTHQWEKIIAIMLTGPAMCIKAVIPSMKKQNFGRIINIGSVHSIVASAYKSAYVSAKHGILGLAKSIALEVKENDITINTLCPAYVDTPMVRSQIKQQSIAHNIAESEVIKKVMLKDMPKKEFITINELAGTVEFLMGPYAKNITAQSIVLDGGWTAH